jgi:hypothetical protein
MGLAILVMLFVIALLLAVVIAMLAALYDQQKIQVGELQDIRRFQMNPRTRMKRARMRNQPETNDDAMRKLGQISVGKRTVVGGDPKSGLHHQLSKTKGVEDE